MRLLDGLLQRTFLPIRFSPTIPGQQFFRPLRQQSPHFPPFTFRPRDGHGVVGGRLVAHPCDHGGFGPLFYGDAFCPSHRATSDRRGVIGDGMCEALSEIGVVGVEIEKGHDCAEEVFNVLDLDVLTAASVGGPALCIAFGGPLGFEFRSNTVDGLCRYPDSSGENLPALLLLNNPVVAGGLHSTSQGCVTGWQQNPAIGYGQDFAVSGSYGSRCGAWRECLIAHWSPFY